MNTSIRSLIPALLVLLPATAHGEPGSWSGGYAGLSLGYGGGRDRVSEVNGPRTYFADTRGVLGSLQVGWQRQFATQWLAGVEVEGGHLGQSGNSSRTDAGSEVRSDAKLEGYGAVSGRVGYIAQPDWLAFGRAGVALAGVSARTTQSCPSTACTLMPASAATRDHTVGLTLGAGVEHAFTNRWVGRIEYQYMRFREELALPEGGAPGPGWHHTLDLHALKVGLNYRF